MEDVYTIKVKSKPDTRNLYPSERRYSASTVSGLAWVHIALAATSFLLACLALVNPNGETAEVNMSNFQQKTGSKNDVFNYTNIDDNATYFPENTTEFFNDVNSTDTVKQDSNYILVLAPSLLTMFALAAGLASIMASVRWYIDRNITWLFIISMLSTTFAFTSFVMVLSWLVSTDLNLSQLNKEDLQFKDYFVVRNSDVIHKNESHIVIKNTPVQEPEDGSQMFTKRVLSINILIAAFLELLWSILSVKIAYKGMKNTYKDDNVRPGNCISVVTTIKGNNTKKLPRNCKILPPKSDLIEHYPNSKIKRIFLAQNDNGFYLKNQNNKGKQNTETSSEFYKERMMNFLNRCASLEDVSNPEVQTPSEHSEAVLNTIPEVTSVEINAGNHEELNSIPISWGDTPDHTIYNQNTLNLDKIFHFKTPEKDRNEEKEHST